MIRTAFLLSLISLPLAASANEGPLPGESNDEVVEFYIESTLFDGPQFLREIGFGSSSSDWSAGVRFVVDVETFLSFPMQARSSMEWPDILENSWGETETGGRVSLRNSGRVAIDLYGTIFGTPISYAVWERSLNWVEFIDISGLLLEGTRQGPSVTLRSTGDSLFTISESFTISDITITITGTIKPILDAVLTGRSINIDGQHITSTAETALVAAPRTNNGSAEFQSRWHGDFSGDMGLRLGLEGSARSGGGTTVSTPELGYDLMIFSDEAKSVQSEWASVSHDLPAIRTSELSLDLGRVILGDSSSVELTVENHGNVELYGDVWAEGDGYVFADYSLLLARNNHGAPTRDTFSVGFQPTELGEFTGTLFIHTNDPVQPYIEISLMGVGVDPADPGGDPNDPGNGSGLVTQEGRGCGCSSVSPAGSLGALALLGLGGLLARRRRR